MEKSRLFLESRYRKLVRGLPQTVYYCPKCRGGKRRRIGCKVCEGFGKLTKDSVQELIARKLLKACGARQGAFHGAGREDIDVLMLGRGRPFVFEVKDAQRDDVDLQAVVDAVHEEFGAQIQIDPFKVVDRKRVGELKEAHYAKRYLVGVALGEPAVAEAAELVQPEQLAGLVGRRLELQQRTPERVAHRRADLVRPREVVIHDLRVAPADTDPGEEPVVLELDLETQHGTYVKEFVSSDGGRTEPSLASLLGVPARCVRLDVLDILDVMDIPDAAAAPTVE